MRDGIGGTDGVIAEGWREFERRILDPVGTGRVLRLELRRAFYAGALSLFGALTEGGAGISPGDEPTEADMELMDAIKAEFDAFGRALKAGRA
jgi:hypothetical protein